MMGSGLALVRCILDWPRGASCILSTAHVICRRQIIVIIVHISRLQFQRYNLNLTYLDRLLI